MPKLTIHPLSVLAGAAIVGLVLLTSSQAPLLPTGFRIEYLPHPRDYVQIKGASVYTVPAGKILVLTAVGANAGCSGNTFVFVDSQFETSVFCEGSGGSASVVPLPQGFTVQAGSAVELRNNAQQPAGDRRAWGYLASQ